MVRLAQFNPHFPNSRRYVHIPGMVRLVQFNQEGPLEPESRAPEKTLSGKKNPLRIHRSGQQVDLL